MALHDPPRRAQARTLEGSDSQARLRKLQKRFKTSSRGLGRGRRPRPAPRPAHRPALRLGLTLTLLFAMVGAWVLLDPVPAARVVPSERISGMPTRVIDGDTFDFGPLRVRLESVDAPEMSTPHGEPARRHLASLIAAGGPIRCEDTGARTYDRIVAHCVTAQGRDLEAAMVEDGWARDIPRFSHGRHLWRQLRATVARRGMHAG